METIKLNSPTRNEREISPFRSLTKSIETSIRRKISAKTQLKLSQSEKQKRTKFYPNGRINDVKCILVK